MKNTLMGIVATAGIIAWFVFLFNPIPWLKPIIGVGFGFSYGRALVGWMFERSPYDR